jgi:hypothetical protein
LGALAAPADAETYWQGATGAWVDPNNWTNGVPANTCYYGPSSSAYIDNGGEAQIDVVYVPGTTTIPTFDDATVTNTEPGANYGEEEFFGCFNATPMAPDVHHYGYVKFYLSSIPDDAAVTEVTLRLRVYSTAYNLPFENDSFSIYEAQSDEWSESTITWSNQPWHEESPLFYMRIRDLPASGDDVDITIPIGVINNAVSTDKKVSFVLTCYCDCDSDTDQAFAKFNSHENVAGAKLIVNYTITTGDAAAQHLYLGGTAERSGMVTQSGRELVIGNPGEGCPGCPPSQGDEGCGGVLSIGNEGTGQFTQTGGTVTVHNLFRLGFGGGQGTYNLSGGQLNVTGYWAWIPEEPEPGQGHWYFSSGWAQLAWEGQATFNHTAGTFSVGVDPYDNRTPLGMASEPNSLAEYNLSGTGELHASYESLDGEGRAIFRQTGGTNRVEETLNLRGRNGGNVTYRISAGTLIAETLGLGGNATFDIAASEPEIFLEYLYLGHGTFKAVPGSKIHLSGSNGFRIGSTDPNAVVGLTNVELIFERDYYSKCEVPGKDICAVTTGFESNFALGTLRVGDVNVGKVRLYDDFDNQPDREGSQALYVENLILSPGSTLDLNGYNLYYQNFTDLGGTIILNGGRLTQVTGSIPGDFDADNDADSADFSILALSWMSEPGDANWNAACDISDPPDSIIDELDLGVFAENWLCGK